MKDYKKTKQQLISELESLQERNCELEFLVTALKRIETRHQEIIDSVPGMVFEIDLEGNLLYFNRRVTEFLGQIESGTDRFNVLQAIVPEERERARSNILRVYSGAKIGRSEYCLQKLDGSRVPVLVHSSPIVVDGRTVGIRGVAFDISEQKLLSEQLDYLQCRDPLTGLYNHRHFAKMLKDIEPPPIGLLIFDVDGLQRVNDDRGSEAGDALLAEAARIVKECFSQGEIIARIGGDEFAVLIPGCTRNHLEEAKQRLKEQIGQHNAQRPESQLNISIGCSYTDRPLDETKTLFAEALNSMYREKLYQSWSTRSAVVNTLMINDIGTSQPEDCLIQINEKLSEGGEESSLSLPGGGGAEEADEEVRVMNQTIQAFMELSEFLVQTYEMECIFFVTDTERYTFVMDKGLDLPGVKVG
ncbi:MAG: diguanylate cyclase, partial [Syntrophomonadaceae bacterium]|nr:diguanylate cyclase [Syntrophomonadaceae bacterium]